MTLIFLNSNYYFFWILLTHKLLFCHKWDEHGGMRVMLTLPWKQIGFNIGLTLKTQTHSPFLSDAYIFCLHPFFIIFSNHSLSFFAKKLYISIHVGIWVFIFLSFSLQPPFSAAPLCFYNPTRCVLLLHSSCSFIFFASEIALFGDLFRLFDWISTWVLIKIMYDVLQMKSFLTVVSKSMFFWSDIVRVWDMSATKFDYLNPILCLDCWVIVRFVQSLILIFLLVSLIRSLMNIKSPISLGWITSHSFWVWSFIAPLCYCKCLGYRHLSFPVASKFFANLRWPKNVLKLAITSREVKILEVGKLEATGFMFVLSKSWYLKA